MASPSNCLIILAALCCLTRSVLLASVDKKPSNPFLGNISFDIDTKPILKQIELLNRMLRIMDGRDPNLPDGDPLTDFLDFFVLGNVFVVVGVLDVAELLITGEGPPNGLQGIVSEGLFEGSVIAQNIFPALGEYLAETLFGARKRGDNRRKSSPRRRVQRRHRQRHRSPRQIDWTTTSTSSLLEYL